jgi:hypothetical protein
MLAHYSSGFETTLLQAQCIILARYQANQNVIQELVSRFFNISKPGQQRSFTPLCGFTDPQDQGNRQSCEQSLKACSIKAFSSPASSFDRLLVEVVRITSLLPLHISSPSPSPKHVPTLRRPSRQTH